MVFTIFQLLQGAMRREYGRIVLHTAQLSATYTSNIKSALPKTGLHYYYYYTFSVVGLPSLYPYRKTQNILMHQKCHTFSHYNPC